MFRIYQLALDKKQLWVFIWVLVICQPSMAAVGFCPTNGAALTLVNGAQSQRYAMTPNIDGLPSFSGTMDLGDIAFGQTLQLVDFESDPVAFASPDLSIVDAEFWVRAYSQGQRRPLMCVLIYR